MKVSLNWVKQYTNVELPVDKLVEKIGAQLGAVDEVINLGERYQGIVVAKVVECRKHPGADKLHICLINDARRTKNVKRDSRGLVQVVCGAPNVATGQLVAWIPPSATVPSTYYKDPYVLEAKELRGIISNGMIASAKELALGDSHEGILVIDRPAKPGQPFAEVYELDDVLIDIENKMFTHRPDLFGILGLAREISGIQGKRFKSPSWYSPRPKAPAAGSNGLILSVSNEVPKLVPRFMAISLSGVNVQASSPWVQSYLSRVGIRPINSVVDITNYMMYLTAQPLHAYDYDKLKTKKLGVRLAKPGERLKIIGGKTINLQPGSVVITDGQKPIGLGGVMGGAETEVDASSRNIVLECATFDMNATRKSARVHGLFTDAATRFTKNQSPLQSPAVFWHTVFKLQKITGAKPGKLVDDKHLTAVNRTVHVPRDFINERLGLSLSSAQIKQLLQNVEFVVKRERGKLAVTPPFWRTDVEIPEDVVEEIGRLHGYDHLPLVLPHRDVAPAKINELLNFKVDLRGILARAGANEVLTYSFVHGDLLEKVGQDKAMAYKLSNALSPDLQYYRLSLTPSLLEKVHPNQKAGFNEFALFEINKAHNKNMKDEADKALPRQFEMLSLVFASSLRSSKNYGAPFYEARALLDYLAKELGIVLDYQPFKAEESYQVVKPFDWRRSAQVRDAQTKAPLGMIGEYKPSVTASLKLPAYSAGFEVDVEGLMGAALRTGLYTPLNRYPSSVQDICLKVQAKLTYGELDNFVWLSIDDLSKKAGLSYSIRTLDIFQKKTENAHKQITWRVSLAHPDRTLTTGEVNNFLDDLAAGAKTKFKAERI